MCHRDNSTTVADGVHLNGRRHYEIAKANYRGSWLMLKTRLAPICDFVGLGARFTRARPPNLVNSACARRTEF